MDDRELYRRMRAGLAAELRMFGSSASESRLVERAGVLASICPTTPDRSLFNGIAYEDADSLEQAYPDLERAYEDAGVRAFTVWVDPGDARVEAFLESRGHRLDGRPVAMAAPLESISLDVPDGLDVVRDVDAATVARINDAAYGFPSLAFGAGMARFSQPEIHAYAVRDGDELVTTTLVIDAGDDATVSAVATLPEYRRRGLATHLLSVALADAVARGSVTTSLQASSSGAPVYARMGYRSLGAMGMWEKRKPPP